MVVTTLRNAFCFGVLLVSAVPALAQVHGLPEQILGDPGQAAETPILGEIRFTGLRRIAPEAVAAQIGTHPGDRFAPARVAKDVRALARLGWFESIQVEATPSAECAKQSPENSKCATLIFHVSEFPFLSKVEFSGSRLLSQKQIDKLLEDKKLAPALGKPADPAALQRIAFAIRTALNELGHPEGGVRIDCQDAYNGTVSVRFEINDGPSLRVRRVNFDGHPLVSIRPVRRQMKNIAPWKPLAAWRGKNAYTRETFEEDRQRILAFYQNHGFPQARVGGARVTQFTGLSRRWLPWPHESPQAGLSVSIPIEAGPYYRFESIAATDALLQAAREHGHTPIPVSWQDGSGAFSQEKIDKLQRLWTASIQSRNPGLDRLPSHSVDMRRTFDSENHTARITFDVSDSLPYRVERIEFLGLHKFSDRYVRRRIALREGHAIDERALEAGLLRLARTGYFKPIHKEDIRVQIDETARTAKVSIHLEEIGQQRASLTGGTGQFGSTLGIVYTVFDLLTREELLSAQFDGGPETLQVMLGVAKEGIFGTRASLAFSVFNDVIRPRFARSAHGPFFSAYSEGINIPWTYPLSNTDSLGVNYTLSGTITKYPLASISPAPGVALGDVRSKTSSRSLGTAWTHDTGNEHFQLANSASGGWLGGSENLVRSSAEYSRILRDRIFPPHGAWAFRTTFNGAASYRGNLPFYARLFSGDELVRGLHPGELGPDAVTVTTSASSGLTYSAAPAGANLVSASTAEYRFPLAGGTEAAGFFDLGSGWLLPNWLGPTKPLLLGATNGALHGSTGIELRWTVPGVQVPVRAYYALNVLRLNRTIPLSNTSSFLVHNRFSAFGWGVGTLF
jgi:outer membrane protein insertion porin family